ncbi:3-dehydroquinate synthase [Prochlorococcus sp. MIT 0601]|nr:3-dehydroquinate synthase [Prochlorococcus sp. MIT 0601]
MNQNTIRINVKLERNPYEVVIGRESLKKIGAELIKLKIKEKTKVLVVSNPDVANPYGELFIKNLRDSGYEAHLLVIEAGEDKKNLRAIEQIHDVAFEKRLERSSLMIAFGGGVIGDMTGFAAATWLRGIDFIQVPTTLLAMVDASIGGKTGVNHTKGKNLIGSFHQPKLVLIDPNVLKTLPEREFRAGMAEVIKYAIIGDEVLFNNLEKIPDLTKLSNISDANLLEVLNRSVRSKIDIIVKDEFESGIRAILNYGHTFGHVIEALCGYGVWLHGEAVSIGMVTAGALALERGLWSKKDYQRQEHVLKRAGLPTVWPEMNLANVIRSLKSDKKVKDGGVRFILPTKIGQVNIYSDFSEDEIKECLSKLKQA